MHFPGCTHHRWVDAHHIHHWAHGGATEIENLASLCQTHHRLVHEGGFTVERATAGGGLVFYSPRGERIAPAPRPPVIDPDGLARWAASPGAPAIDDATGLTRWDGTRVDYRAAIDALVTH